MNFVTGKETEMDSTAYNNSANGLLTIDLTLLESLADFDNPSDPDYKLFSQVHNLATKVRARNKELQGKEN